MICEASGRRRLALLRHPTTAPYGLFTGDGRKFETLPISIDSSLLRARQAKGPGLHPGLSYFLPGPRGQKSMPPMPPPPGIAGAAFFFGTSATIASVVMRRPATDAAPCNAARTTLVGSMMPLDTRLPYSPDCAS